jgi:hypothetical protein
MLLLWGIAAVGFSIALVAVLSARAGRLSVGHGTAWALAGVALLIAGVGLGRLGRAHAGFTAGGAIGLTLALALGGAFGVVHAIALSRLNERVKRLAQEVALLRVAAGPSDGDRVAAEAGASEDAAPPTG